MRLWSLDPAYLDAKGLVALWREGLLAQKVLMGLTKGYKNHPQLDRFKDHPDPPAAIAFYLHKVCEEAGRRGYKFDAAKIRVSPKAILPIKLSKGQLAFEVEHLNRKLRIRDSEKYRLVCRLKKFECHPIFELVSGGIAPWEKP